MAFQPEAHKEAQITASQEAFRLGMELEGGSK
jgi:hypothetical protein